MLTSRRLRVRQAEADAAGAPPNGTRIPTELSLREHQSALWELKNQHAAELERLRAANRSDDTETVKKTAQRIAELEKENAELQSKIETLSKQAKQQQDPRGDTTPTDTKAGAAPYGATNEGAPLGEQTQAPAAAPLDNKGDDKLEAGKPPAAPEPSAPPATANGPVAPAKSGSDVKPTGDESKAQSPKGNSHKK
jgi:hypothetical protein